MDPCLGEEILPGCCRGEAAGRLQGIKISQYGSQLRSHVQGSLGFLGKRFTEFANGAGGEDELTKKEAKAAVEHMKAVVKAWEMENESIAG